MAIYLFSKILKFTKYSMKLIEKLSRRHLINSSDLFVIKGFTVSIIYLSRLSGITEDQVDADVIKPSLAKGPNPSLRKGPNDDLLL